jgi:SAM-dependent methyltransferase
MKQEEDKNSITIQTYNNDPVYFASRCNKIGLRKKDIDKAFSLLKTSKNRCLEIGCGNGIDARYILAKTSDYLGLDASEGLLKLAKNNNPGTDFRLGDIREIDFEPNSFDIIFALASLLCLNYEENKDLFPRIWKWLEKDGIFYLTLRMGDETELEKKNERGNRFFFIYKPGEIRKLAQNNGFSVVYEEKEEILGVNWFKMALKKISD